MSQFEPLRQKKSAGTRSKDQTGALSHLQGPSRQTCELSRGGCFAIRRICRGSVANCYKSGMNRCLISNKSGTSLGWGGRGILQADGDSMVATQGQRRFSGVGESGHITPNNITCPDSVFGPIHTQGGYLRRSDHRSEQDAQPYFGNQVH